LLNCNVEVCVYCIQHNIGERANLADCAPPPAKSAGRLRPDGYDAAKSPGGIELLQVFFMKSSRQQLGISEDQQDGLKRYDNQMQEAPGKVKNLALLLVRAALIAYCIVAVFAYVFFSPPVLTAVNGGMLLFPIPPGEEYKFDTINGVKRQDVFFANKAGNKLHGWFFQSSRPDAPVVLFCHGNAGNIGHRLLFVHYLMNAGASVFLFDYRSFGRSEGIKSLSGLVEDCQSAFDYLTGERKIPACRIVIYGESIGGGPACMLASTRQSAGLILDSTFTTLMRIARKKISAFGIYPDFLQPIPAFDNTAVLAGKHVPVLIIHGKKDEIMPFSEAESNFAAASQPKALLALPNSEHNNKDPDFKLYEDGVRKFLNSIKESAHESR
jgi:uncharacterized protein